MRKQKGITLISLIITIILLLILVGASLGIILQGNFFYKARRTAKMADEKISSEGNTIEKRQNDWEQMEIDICSHIWGEERTILEPTCSISGKKEKVCLNCGKMEETEIPKLQHIISSWQGNVDKTHSRKCTNCEYIETEPHTYQDGECIKCGLIVFYVQLTSYTSPKGKTWEEWCESDYQPYETYPHGKPPYQYKRFKVAGDYCINQATNFSVTEPIAYYANAVSTEGSYETIVLPTDMIIPAGNYYIYVFCLAWDTEISVVYEDEKGRKRVKKKKIQELKPGDEILSFDWKTMKLVPNKVKYVDGNENKTHYQYDKWIFDDGTIIKTVHKHEFYNVEAKRFKYMDEWNIGDHAYKQDGTKPKLIAHEVISQVVRHCTIVGANGTNYFANDLLSGDRTCPKEINL